MLVKILLIGICSLVVDGGVLYTRWGRNDCPGDTRLVYAGVAAGGHYQQPGGGSDFICMSLEVEYTADLNTRWPSKLYGSEYDLPGVPSIYNHNIPCAVCRVGPRSTQLMIPGRVSCPGPKWTKEYSGKLATGHHSHVTQKQHICLDQDMESGGNHQSTKYVGALLYLVEGVCGSLPCPPYQNNREITCVVCSK